MEPEVLEGGTEKVTTPGGFESTWTGLLVASRALRQGYRWLREPQPPCKKVEPEEIAELAEVFSKAERIK